MVHFCNVPGCAKGRNGAFLGFAKIAGLSAHMRTHKGLSPPGRTTGRRPLLSQSQSQSQSQEESADGEDVPMVDAEDMPTQPEFEASDADSGTSDSDDEMEVEEDSEPAAAAAFGCLAEAVQHLGNAPREGESRQDWASRLLCQPKWPDEAAHMRWELEDTELKHCEQWYGATREQRYNDDTERLLQVAHAPHALVASQSLTGWIQPVLAGDYGLDPASTGYYGYSPHMAHFKRSYGLDPADTGCYGLCVPLRQT